jgi:hypothetical protein
MYGYKTSHVILVTYLNWQMSTMNITPRPTIDVVELGNIISKKNGFKIGQYIVYLEAEGYFKFIMNEQGGHTIEFTEKGVSAATGSYFRIKQHRLVWTIVMNVLMTVCTIAVAIATIITLLSVEPRIKQLEKEQQRLEQSKKELQGAANPNTLPQKMSVPHPSSPDTMP